nr:acyl-CoA carboxylase epsilon subunit [Streptomyces sp. SID12501]
MRGEPTPDELGALVAVLTALRARTETAAAGDDTSGAGAAVPRAAWDRGGNGYRSPLAWVG